jgi:hypothetical protein
MYLERKDGCRVLGPYLYFMQSNGYVKIGTAMNPLKRLYTVQSCNPHEVYLLAVIQGGMKEELAWHVRFEAEFVRGEWFRYSGRLRDAIAELGDRVVAVPVKASMGTSKMRRIENRRSKLELGGIVRATRSPITKPHDLEVKSA